MTTKSPVPRLDLAPKLRRPLSLWNPLDYLLLLYWVFYFPQALRWYVDTFGGGYIPKKEMNWSEGIKILRQNSVQRKLLFQSVVLTIIIPILICLCLQKLGLSVNWLGVGFGVALGVGFGVALGVALGVAFGVVFGVVFGVAFGVVFGVAFGVVLGVARGVAEGVTGSIPASNTKGVTFIVVLGVAYIVAYIVPYIVPLGVAGGVALGVAGGVAGGMAEDVAENVAEGVAEGVAEDVAEGVESVNNIYAYIVVGLMIAGLLGYILMLLVMLLAVLLVARLVVRLVGTLRLENWLFGLLLNLRYLRNSSFLLPRITVIPLPYLDSRLKKWLLQDWEKGIHNVNQLLAYTRQSIPVVKAVNKALEIKPEEEIIWSISQLAETTYDWKLIYFTSADLSKKTNTRLDTPSRAVAAGFWYLHEKQPTKATKAFEVVRSLLYGEEMYILTKTLAEFNEIKELDSIANLPIPIFPTSGLLRPVTWQTLDRFVKVIEDIKIIKGSFSRVSRSSALNRALGELTTILNTADTLPKAEKELIIDIAKNWQQQLLQITGEVGETVITKPVNNPYVIGDPIMGNLFVGREDIIRQLEELWLRSYQLQSVVIYGHRRMGKTSILRNAANSLDNQVKVVYVNLLKLGNVTQGVGEVLMAISDKISQVLNIEPPNDDDLLKLPERTFNRYFEKVIKDLSGRLIIAIDEFEKIEELIKAGKISPDFMGFLRGLVQEDDQDDQVAFAFAGLHTLDEMTADYFHPFFGSFPHIPVGFLNRQATGQILANPAIEDFLLDYTPEAVNRIYDLTYGQPYLVQLVGFHLVRLYNNFVFEQGRNRDPVFTVEDVETIVKKPEFFTRGSNYFNGVWGQAGENNDHTQQIILTHLAKYPQGLNVNDLVELTGINETDLQKALETLKRHDVVVENQGRWKIIVELFRRWVVKTHS